MSSTLSGDHDDIYDIFLVLNMSGIIHANFCSVIINIFLKYLHFSESNDLFTNTEQLCKVIYGGKWFN